MGGECSRADAAGGRPSGYDCPSGGRVPIDRLWNALATPIGAARCEDAMPAEAR